MRALVTGATGFVGSALTRRLAEAGAFAVRITRRAGTTDTTPPGYESVETALDDVGSLIHAVRGVDVVFHLAARLRGPTAELVHDAAVTTDRIARAILAAPRPPRLVLASSFGVYETSHPTAPGALDESARVEGRPEARDGYSLAKWLAERVAFRHTARAGLRLVVVRAGTLWGPSRSPITARVGFRIGRTLLHLGGECAVPLCHVERAVDALVVAATRMPDGGVVNVVEDAPPTARALAALASEELGLEVISVPPEAVFAGSRAWQRVVDVLGGQLPAGLTEYRARSLYTPHRYDNGRLRGLGWRPRPLPATALKEALS